MKKQNQIIDTLKLELERIKRESEIVHLSQSRSEITKVGGENLPPLEKKTDENIDLSNTQVKSQQSKENVMPLRTHIVEEASSNVKSLKEMYEK